MGHQDDDRTNSANVGSQSVEVIEQTTELFKKSHQSPERIVNNFLRRSFYFFCFSGDQVHHSAFVDMIGSRLRRLSGWQISNGSSRNQFKAFYQLCTYMEPNYHQLEFGLRLYLTHRDG